MQNMGINIKSGFVQLSKNQMPVWSNFGCSHSLCSILLIIPGFATDFLGFLLIFPLTRKLIFSNLSKKFNHKKKSNNDFIDGEYEDIEDDNDRKI